MIYPPVAASISAMPTRETKQVSVTLPVSFLDDLVAEFPAASRHSQAVKLAAQAGLEDKQEQITPAKIEAAVERAIRNSKEPN